MKPRIGISAGERTRIENYIHAITSSGGEPVLLTPDGRVDSILAGLDGLLLTGGGDIPPHFWGENLESATSPKDELRARFELPLVREAAQKGIPILGICLGLQAMNVALGGTLHLDLDAPSAERHCKKSDGTSSYHQIEIVEGSRLSTILPHALTVNSRHHQAIKKLAPELKISASAEDGIIEAIEKNGTEWIMGVQWHPEDLAASDEHQKALFSSFINACRT